MKSRFQNRYTRFVALLAVGSIAAIGVARAGGWQDNNEQLAQSAELEKLHAVFSAAAFLGAAFLAIAIPPSGTSGLKRGTLNDPLSNDQGLTASELK